MRAEPVVFTPRGMEPDQRAIAQLERCLADDEAVSGALMADHHLGYSMPIGGVVAYDNAVSPSGVGFDIACGNKCVRTNLLVSDEDFVDDVQLLLPALQKRIAFGLGRNNPTPIEHPLFDREIWHDLEKLKPGLKQKAEQQLGTVGSGNHYLDLLVGDDGRVWIANHFGSRGLGHTIATGFLNLAKGQPFDAKFRETETPTVLRLNTVVGDAYFEAMKLAGEYAYSGRDYVIDQVLELLGATSDFEVHNHHNYAWLEAGQVVVRKGATPLTSEPAFIGGSMGDVSVIVRGTGEEIGNLASAPHGAGRLMSRTAAAGKTKRRKMYGCPARDCGYEITPQEFDQQIKRSKEIRNVLKAPSLNEATVGPPFVLCPDHNLRLRKFTKLERTTDGLIDWPAAQAELRARGIIVAGGGADEAPGVYKPLRDVLAAHPNVEILHELQPIGVVMAGANEFDPYKD